MQAYFGERGCEFDQASAILDSNSEEAWRDKNASQGVGVRLKGEVTGEGERKEKYACRQSLFV